MVGCGTKDRYWNGRIDDLRVYNRALDPNEIVNVRAGVEGLSGKIFHWRFDEAGSDIDIRCRPQQSAIIHWSAGGVKQYFSPGADAFYKRISRP